MVIDVEKIDPHEAEAEANEMEKCGFDARRVVIDGDELIVIAYGNGPTLHIAKIFDAIDALATT